MGTVTKALELLNIMANSPAPLGLTALASKAQYDKATTRRMLIELLANGFVEQDTESRSYGLGPALQSLGKLRESRFPLVKTVQPFVKALAKKTEEMVHATEYGNGFLYSISVEESTKANRISLELGQKLPLHATASGIAFLAASTDSFIETVLKKPLATFTPQTTIDKKSLIKSIIETSARGYSISNQTFDEGVHSVAAAYYSASGKPLGTIAIAMPTLRATPKMISANGKLVSRAVTEISASLGFNKSHLRSAS